MKLYYKPGACSLASRIVLTELGLPFEAIRVDTDAALTETGADYRAINAKGYVPALELDDGAVITENPAILQYLADKNPVATLAPVHGSLDRVRLQEWLNFISAELHKAYGPFFTGKELEAAEKAKAEIQIARRIAHVEDRLSDGRDFLMGDGFTVADAYLFVVLKWSNFIGFDLARWPHVEVYVARLAERRSVKAAMMSEGLIAQVAA